MTVLPILIYRFNAFSVKIPASYFMDINRLILKFMQRGEKKQTEQKPQYYKRRTKLGN